MCRQRHQIIILTFYVACSFEISQYITKHFALDAAAQKAAGEPGYGLKVARFDRRKTTRGRDRYRTDYRQGRRDGPQRTLEGGRNEEGAEYNAVVAS